MISNIIAFLAGALFASFAPDSFRAWVRGVAGKARDLFVGANEKVPARSVQGSADASRQNELVGDFVAASQVSPDGRNNRNSRNKPISLAQFLGALWNWKWAIVAVLFFALGLGVLRGWIPSPFGKSRDELRFERDLAEAEARTQEALRERDEEIAAIRVNTARELAQIRLESQRGYDEIAAATPEHEEPLDPELVAAWRASLDRLCVPRANGDRADTC